MLKKTNDEGDKPRRSRREAVIALPQEAKSGVPLVDTTAQLEKSDSGEKPARGRREARLRLLEQKAGMTMPLVDTVAKLGKLQTQRKFCIKSQSRCDRSIEELIARLLGYKPDASPKDRKAIWKKAAAQRRAGEAGKPIDPAVEGIAELITLSAAGRGMWDNHRLHVEGLMEELAKQLPVWPFAKEVEGFGAKGLAVFVGEAGAFTAYAKVSRLWKRMGLAVFDGERQRRKTNIEAALRHGYSPSRRAEVWAFTDSMFRHQWRGRAAALREALEAAGASNPEELKEMKEEELQERADALGVTAEAYPLGKYGKVYAYEKTKGMRKAAETTELDAKNPAKWTLRRAHDHGRRIMSKTLLEDLWKQWRRVVPEV